MRMIDNGMLSTKATSTAGNTVLCSQGLSWNCLSIQVASFDEDVLFVGSVLDPTCGSLSVRLLVQCTDWGRIEGEIRHHAPNARVG